MKPVHTHDCDKCIYFGSVPRRLSEEEHDMIDVYWCTSITRPAMSSVLGRYGSKGEEYVASHPPECFAVDRETFLARQERWYLYALLHATWRGLYTPPSAEVPAATDPGGRDE